jgi:polysaccharide pyruvyl transferase WcaK-like protein
LSSDVLVVGGGGIFSGHMGTMGKLVPLFSRLALARRARVSFHGIGIYSSAPRHVLRGIVSLVPKLTSLTVRDTASARLLRSWGIDASIVPDLSQGMAPAQSTRGEELIKTLGLSPTRPRVALCLTAIEQGLAESLIRSLPSLIDTLPDVQFVFIPMSHHPTMPHHNDLRFAHRLRSRVPQLVVLDDRLHPVEVLGLLSQFPVIVAMRYHALLFAERVGAAVVPIPYAEKCYSWLEDHGLEPANTDAESLTERIRQALSDRRVGVGGGRAG